jgi:hypothetical protein
MVQCEVKYGAIDLFSARYYLQCPTYLARAFLHTPCSLGEGDSAICEGWVGDGEYGAIDMFGLSLFINLGWMNSVFQFLQFYSRFRQLLG